MMLHTLTDRQLHRHCTSNFIGEAETNELLNRLLDKETQEELQADEIEELEEKLDVANEQITKLDSAIEGLDVYLEEAKEEIQRLEEKEAINALLTELDKIIGE